MGSRRAETGRGPFRVWWVALVVVAALVTAGVVAFGLRSGGGAPPAARSTPSPSPTPVRQVGLSNIPIPRARFCDWIGDAAVREAMGGAIGQQDNYNSGDKHELAPGFTDVAHEYDCTFEGVSGAVARAWVFAPPVQTGTARTLVRDARRQRGCTILTGGPRYGDPTVTTACASRIDGKPMTAVTLAGLFGDAWFSCQVSVPGGHEAATQNRAEKWCVHVATTLGARP
ncbi:MAG: hypothetical protein ACXVWU_02880 [Nocardioides sp.]